MGNEYKIGQSVSEKLTPVTVNEFGDKIYLDINDTTFVNKVITLFQWFPTIEEKISDLQKNYEADLAVLGEDSTEPDANILAVYKQCNEQVVELYKDVCDQFDSVFGKDTIRKYFRALYEAYGDDFVPDDTCISDFIEEIIPVLEQLFNVRKESLRRNHTKTKKGSGRTPKTKDQLLAELKNKKDQEND